MKSLGFFRLIGDCNPNIFEIFTMYIYKCKRSLRKYVQTPVVILVIALISLIIYSSILSFDVELFPQHIILEYISSIAHGFIAGKNSARREQEHAVSPAVSALIYALTQPP